MERSTSHGSLLEEEREYTRNDLARRHGSHAHQPSVSRLRIVFFSLAALWGFLLGALTVGVTLQLTEPGLAIHPLVVLAILPGAGLAIAGGAVSAAAYRQARGHHRR
jgi:hypothetical protein